ncbi:MAG: pirin-like C-terminal cupin domain-containing protein [Lautropia sp.]|nr:pirin-like C-terminal cupin domain-containing protein [Lautropia sp.]
MKKTIIGVTRPLAAQPVGNAWQEQLFFGYQGLGRQTNPAILASHVPAQPMATDAEPRSTGVQARAGFECVTLLLQGELLCRDSADTDQRLSTGDVLWQGAGRGALYEDLPAPLDTGRQSDDDGQTRDDTLQLLRFWINLPADYKGTDPHSQFIPAAQIPTLELPGGAGNLRVIAGEWNDRLGPAETVTPLQLWEIQACAGHSITLPLPRRWYALLLVLEGQVRHHYWPTLINGPQLALLDAAGDELSIDVLQDTRLVLLSCEPLDEPIMGHDTLVMNTAEQLQTCETKLAAGEFGTL